MTSLTDIVYNFTLGVLGFFDQLKARVTGRAVIEYINPIKEPITIEPRPPYSLEEHLLDYSYSDTAERNNGKMLKVRVTEADISDAVRTAPKKAANEGFDGLEYYISSTKGTLELYARVRF